VLQIIATYQPLCPKRTWSSFASDSLGSPSPLRPRAASSASSETAAAPDCVPDPQTQASKRRKRGGLGLDSSGARAEITPSKSDRGRQTSKRSTGGFKLSVTAVTYFSPVSGPPDRAKFSTSVRSTRESLARGSTKSAANSKSCIVPRSMSSGERSRAKVKVRLTAEEELAIIAGKKMCTVCNCSESAHEVSSNSSSSGTVAWRLCSVCDDAFGMTCAFSQDPNCQFDSEFTCKTCWADSELKDADQGKDNPRRFSSEWLQSTHTSSTSAVSARLLPSFQASDRVDSLQILQQPSRPLLVSRLKRSKSALKMPKWSDCTDEERAHSRQCLAAALTEKGIGFDDDLSYPFADCPEVPLSVVMTL
jgi:hypothetical protein